MLVELSVQDFVIIERATLEPATGLTVVTGATGDGKTLLLRALRFLLGERVAPERVVREGCERAVVEAVFRLEDAAQRAELRALGAPEEWDEPELVLSRTVERSGRGRARIGGRLASAGDLRRVGERLVDILSQHEYQSLARPERQRRVLDSFGHLQERRGRFQEERGALRSAASERDRLVLEREAVLAREERLRSELESLRALAPREGELEELERERGLLANVDAVRRALEAGHERLSEQEGSALALVRATLRELEPQAARSLALGRVVEVLAAAASDLGDAAAQLARERDRLEHDPGRLLAVEERLEAYRDLARRLASGAGAGTRGLAVIDPRALPGRWQALEAEVGEAASPDARVAELEREMAARSKALEALGEELSAARRAAARRLEAAVRATLGELALPEARFEVALERLGTPEVGSLASDRAREGAAPEAALDRVEARFPNPDGIDRVEFRFASSPGLPLLGVGEVASGGELARLCLALKRGLAEADDVPVLVFDEVDQNVGGRLGTALGRTLGEIGRGRQVLAVTHLPSVAAHGAKHILVEKRIEGSGAGPDRRARTSVRALGPDERVREIAVMIRGEPVTPLSLEQARELLAAAADEGAPGSPRAGGVRRAAAGGRRRAAGPEPAAPAATDRCHARRRRGSRAL